MTIRSYMTERFQNKKCDVLGFARSNKPLVACLLEAGALVTVRDRNEGLSSDAEALAFAQKGVSFVLGERYLADMDADYIFRTPAIRPDLPEIVAAVERGAQLSGEMELFLEICPCPVLGITGSDGKTTTTTLTHLMLEKELSARGGRAFVGGNIGAPLLPLAEEMRENDVAVVELSSFQLQSMRISPSRAVITNITPNHLNWHVDMDEYVEAKCNIYRHSGATALVVNAENDVTREIARNTDLPVTYFSSKRSGYADIVPDFKKNCRAVYEERGVICYDDGREREEILSVSEILLPGRHNVENYMAAIALTHGLVSRETVREIAASFGGVEHRLELVREKDGVRFYNSSIDSSPTRTAAAISALPKAPIIILGGSDKNIPFDGLAKDVCERTKAAVVTGESAPKILAEIEKCPAYADGKVTVKHVPDFDNAVRAAADMAEEGDVVLLSPACASFDRFRDFAERGNYFKSIVRGL